jgi:hypothetical protein
VPRHSARRPSCSHAPASRVTFAADRKSARRINRDASDPSAALREQLAAFATGLPLDVRFVVSRRPGGLPVDAAADVALALALGDRREAARIIAAA